MSEAILKQAWIWECPKCGKVNAVEPVPAELLPEDKAELLEDHGLDAVTPGDFYTVPTVVTCDFCGRDFDATVQPIGGES